MSPYHRVLEILELAAGLPSAHTSMRETPWRWLTRDQFVEKRVAGGRLVELGKGSQSWLVRALKGEVSLGCIPTPRLRTEEIAFVERWINEFCPHPSGQLTNQV